jgi:acetyltransferase-like isoleucine patch superfamily enzyme
MLKIKRNNNRIEFYFLGIKIGSHKINQKGINNNIDIVAGLKHTLNIDGENNTIKIESLKLCNLINIKIHGSNNTIIIEKDSHIVNLNINIGNHFPINNSYIYIGGKTWIGDLKIVLESNFSKITIGKDCAISTGVFIRLGEYPHIIFDKSTGQYLGKPESLSIGEHVWLGANSTILTHANIPNGCIVGTNAVVTKKFTEEDSIIAGNPARVCKRNIFWGKDINSLPKDSIYYQSLKNKLCETKEGNYA